MRPMKRLSRSASLAIAPTMLPGLHAVRVADFDAEGFHADFGGRARRLARLARFWRAASGLVVEHRSAHDGARTTLSGDRRELASAGAGVRRVRTRVAVAVGIALAARFALTRWTLEPSRDGVRARDGRSRAFAAPASSSSGVSPCTSLRQRGGDLDRRHVVLALVALDQVAEHGRRPPTRQRCR